jgi:PPOX class probable F420-dependent enzyme
MASLTDKQVQLLKGRNFANVAVIRPDGTPHVTPVWVDWDGENVIVNLDATRKKLEYIRRDPRVSIEVFNLDNPYEYVAVTGPAELTEEGANEHINEMSHKYFGPDRDYPLGDSQRVLVRVKPERVIGSRR